MMQIRGTLTDAEYLRLKIAAMEAGEPVAALIGEILRAWLRRAEK